MAEVRYGDLPFAEAIAYLKDKIDLATDHWDDIQGEEHDHSFIVAGAAKADLLADLHAAVLKGLDQGTTIEEFRRDFEAAVATHGWTGWTGSDTAQGRAWRTATIYETNLRTSYQAGRRAQHLAGAAQRPYLQYHHADGSIHPRPLHVSWNGTVLAADDPWWDSHYTPNGWRCRCYITSLADRDLQRLGKTGPDPTPDDGTYVHKDRQGREHVLPAGIDYGWDHAPGATRDLIKEVQAKAERLPGGIGQDLRAAIAGRGFAARPAAAGAADPIRAALASPAFDDFFAGAPQAPARFAVAALGAAEQRLFGVTGDRLWLSRTTLDEHKARHPEVGVDDYRQIPEIVARGAVWGGQAARRYLVLWIGDKPYRAALKADAQNQEAWFLSLVVSGKQQPPKGAVRLR
ncbi:phage head morphogenesis protein [Lamprocystis purpurea]|jgi:hypothetical protein|uniref:phage head morphogenesis protein n=1 Tax=Lamprocystis purpurea TaxID=61598 RepID=UPI00036AB8E0|nr:phage minor head protein [Lamprocystis purpurea]